MNLLGMFEVKILCSFYFYVCIKKIDISKVEVFKGVYVVVIGVDFFELKVVFVDGGEV